MTSDRSADESLRAPYPRLLCALLFLGSLGFWGLVFNRSILSLDDMGFILRGEQEISSLRDIGVIVQHDVFTQNGRIADSTLSVVAALGEPAARAYFALAATLLFPTALIWLSHLVPQADRIRIPPCAAPIAAAALPFLMLALDRRLISQLVLFGAASSGYFVGLFLVSVGLVPVLRAVDGLSMGVASTTWSSVSLVVGVMFHEILAALVLGAALAAAYVALRNPARRRTVAPLVALVGSVALLKAATPGLWARAADADQRQFSDVSLLGRTDLAIAFALVAFVPLAGYVAGAAAVSLPARGVSTPRLAGAGLTCVALVGAGLAYRVAGGFPVDGLVVLLTVGAVVVVVAVLSSAKVGAAEFVAVGAMVLSLAVPICGGLLPGRAWFFGEFMALLVATSLLVRALPAFPAAGHVSSSLSGTHYLAAALLGSGIVVAPILAYEMLDKVNDNFAWRAFVAAQVHDQGDGSVEIPWTYPWNDMRPSFALDDDHETYEALARTYYGISDETTVVWNGSVDWAAD